MLIVLAFVFGAATGLIIHFATGGRDTRGPAVAPVVAAALGGAVWLLMTWLGLADTGWIWLASIGLPIVVTWLLVTVLTRTRRGHDERERIRLKIA